MAEFSSSGEVRGNGSVYLGQFDPFTFNDLRVKCRWHRLKFPLFCNVPVQSLAHLFYFQVVAVYLTFIDPGMLNEAA